jgi:hypothetical protein
MGSWSQQRQAAAAGILSMVLLVVGYFMPGSPPKYTASGEKVTAFFTGHHRTILIGLILTGIAVPFYVWFVAHLAVALRDAGHSGLGLSVAIGGGLVSAAAAIGDAFTAAADQGANSGMVGATVRALYQTASFTYSRLTFPAIAVAIAVAIAAARGALPAWLKWLGALQAVLLLLTGVSLKADGFFSQTGGMAFIGYIAYFLGTALIAFGFWQASARKAVATTTV